MQGRTISLIVLATMGVVFSGLSPLTYSRVIDSRTVDTVAGHPILKIINVTEKPSLDYPRVIFQDNNDLIYFANDYVGIYDEQQNQIHYYREEKLKLGPWPYIDHILQSPDGKVWVAGGPVGDNLGYFEGEKWVNFGQLFEFPIRTIFPSNQNGIWFAAWTHLIHYDGKEWTHHIEAYKEVKKAKSFFIIQGLQDSSGLLWLGINKGILSYDVQKNQWQCYLYPKTVRTPQYIIEDSKNNLWFADPYQGDVAFYKRQTATWTTFNIRDKLPAKGEVPFKLTGLIQDNHELMFFTTTWGLVTLNPITNQWQVFTPENSGLPDRDITCIYKDRSERIWIGTVRGILVLTP